MSFCLLRGSVWLPSSVRNIFDNPLQPTSLLLCQSPAGDSFESMGECVQDESTGGPSAGWTQSSSQNVRVLGFPEEDGPCLASDRELFLSLRHGCMFGGQGDVPLIINHGKINPPIKEDT